MNNDSMNLRKPKATEEKKKNIKPKINIIRKMNKEKGTDMGNINKYLILACFFVKSLPSIFTYFIHIIPFQKVFFCFQNALAAFKGPQKIVNIKRISNK